MGLPSVDTGSHWAPLPYSANAKQLHRALLLAPVHCCALHRSLIPYKHLNPDAVFISSFFFLSPALIHRVRENDLKCT